MADASLTGLRAVRPRGPRIFLAVLGLAVVGGLAWFFFLRPAGPIGAAEDPGKLLVVGGDEAQAAARSLSELGFDATAMTLAEAEGKARAAELGELSGPQAAMRLADHEGIGYVAFADPSKLSFGDLEVAAGSAVATPAHRWVVFSVGDLGLPSKATVGRGEAPVLELPSWVELMRAVFEQDQPASTLFAESQLPMEAVKLHQQIAPAIEMQGAYGALELKASRLERERQERLVQAETAEPKPVILAAPLEETRALPLPDGGVLLFVRPRIVEGELDPSMRLAMLPSRQIWYHPPGAWGVEDRTRCEALRGGVLPDSRAHWVTAARGQALMFDIGDAWDVWTFDLAAKGTCAFARAGSIPERAEDERGEALAADGRVARSVVEGNARSIRVHDPKGGAKAIELPGCTEVSAPHWIDHDHVVLGCEFDPEVLAPEPEPDAEDTDGTDEDLGDTGDPGSEAEPEPEPEPAVDPAADPLLAEAPPPPPRQVWIYVVNVTSPSIAGLPTSTFQPDASLVEVRPVGTSASLELLLQTPGGFRLLGKLRTTRSAAQLGAAPPADPAAPRPAFVPEDAAIPVVALSAAELEVDLFDIDASGARDVSPDGRWLVREVSPDTHVDPHGYDVALVELHSGSVPKVLASSERAGHVQPLFTADGRHVIFESRYPVDIGASLESAAQILVLPSERGGE
jgi:hypothetical protein